MTPCSSSHSIPTVDIDVTVTDSCNCCFPFRKKKKVKNVTQPDAVDKTDEKVDEIPMKFTSHDSSKSELESIPAPTKPNDNHLSGSK